MTVIIGKVGGEDWVGTNDGGVGRLLFKLQDSERVRDDVNRLTEENAKLREVLGSLVKESLSLADFKNKTLKRSICSTDLDEPEWHDYQTIAEADLLLNQLKEQNNDK